MGIERRSNGGSDLITRKPPRGEGGSEMGESHLLG